MGLCCSWGKESIAKVWDCTAGYESVRRSAGTGTSSASQLPSGSGNTMWEM